MKTAACGSVNPQPEVLFDDISDLVSGKGTPHEQEKTSPQEKPPTSWIIEYPRCFYDPAGIGGAAAFAYDDAQKRPCDQSGCSQAPAAGLMPFGKINLKKIDNKKMSLRVSLQRPGGTNEYRERRPLQRFKSPPILVRDGLFLGNNRARTNLIRFKSTKKSSEAKCEFVRSGLLLGGLF